LQKGRPEAAPIPPLPDTVSLATAHQVVSDWRSTAQATEKQKFIDLCRDQATAQEFLVFMASPFKTTLLSGQPVNLDPQDVLREMGRQNRFYEALGRWDRTQSSFTKPLALATSTLNDTLQPESVQTFLGRFTEMGFVSPREIDTPSQTLVSYEITPMGVYYLDQIFPWDKNKKPKIITEAYRKLQDGKYAL
jgi:hypothetical protein